MIPRFMTYVTLKNQRFISGDELVQAFQARYPKLKIELTAPADTGEAITFSIGNIPLSILQMPFPIPISEFAGALSANRSWPDAAAVLDGSVAHLVVATLASPEDFSDSLALARCLTVVTAVLCRLTSATAVYWAAGDVISSAESFIAAEQAIVASEPPLEQWLQFLFFDVPSQSKQARMLAASTNGLLPFIGRELDLQPVALPPMEIARLLMGTAYICLHGRDIKDGDTVSGGSHVLTARFAEQGFRENIPVIQLRL